MQLKTYFCWDPDEVGDNPKTADTWRVEGADRYEAAHQFLAHIDSDSVEDGRWRVVLVCDEGGTTHRFETVANVEVSYSVRDTQVGITSTKVSP